MYLRPVEIRKKATEGVGEEVTHGYSHGIVNWKTQVGELSHEGPAIIVEDKLGSISVISLTDQVLKIRFLDRNEY